MSQPSLKWICTLFCASLLHSFSSAGKTTEGKVTTSILFNCNISFHASGKSAYLGVGYTKINGLGQMSCYDFVQNVVEEIPIKVKIRGPGVGLGVTGFNISGGQTGIGLNERPEALLGSYALVRGNAAVGAGGSAAAGLRVAKGSFQLALQLDSNSGLGAGVDFLSLELERDSAREVIKHAAPVPAAEELTAAELPAVRVRFHQKIEIVDENNRVVQVIQLKPKSNL